jgi:hypothetical protein
MSKRCQAGVQAAGSRWQAAAAGRRGCGWPAHLCVGARGPPARVGDARGERGLAIALLPGPETAVFGSKAPCTPIQKHHTEPIYDGGC